MHISELAHKRILIVGHGREGKSTERFLRQSCPQAQIDIADAAYDPRYLDQQKSYDIAVKTPGMKKELLVIPYTTATNIFFANCQGTIVGVTGSKGKSTTAALIAHILKNYGKKVYLVGNIGNPALEVLLATNTQDDVFVYELSSFQTETLTSSPHISVITSLFPEHMDYHGSAEVYYQAKKNMTAYVTAEDYFVYNARYPELAAWAQTLPCQSIAVSADMVASDTSVPLAGVHNRENIAAAHAVARLFQVPDDQIFKATATFRPLRHRLERIGTYRGITFYDDAISTAPQSTIAAVNTLSPISVIMLGGEDRGYDFSDLAQVLKHHAIPIILLFPDSGQKIADCIKAVGGYSPCMIPVATMKEAVSYAYEQAKPGTICLLSTASPSYSLWKNYEEKGDQFRRFVEDLGR